MATGAYEPRSYAAGVGTHAEAILDPSYDEVEIFVGDTDATPAVTVAALLEAADDLGLPASVVQITADGSFTVPAAVAAAVDVADPLNATDVVGPKVDSRTKRAKPVTP